MASAGLRGPISAGEDPPCPAYRILQEGSGDRGRQRRLGLPQARGTCAGEEGDEEEAPVEVVALEEQPQLGGGAARLRADGPRS